MDGISHREFQNYLGLLGRLLRLRAAQRTAIEEELRAHMEERFAALSSQGIEPEQAVSMALAEFGDAAALAAEFTAISRLQKRRWMMRFTIGSIAATILLTAVVVSMWPNGPGELADLAAQAQQVEKPAPPGAEKPAPPKAEKPAPKRDANAQTQAKLEAHADAEFVDTPVTDVLDYVADVAKVQVYLDRRALEERGVVANESLVTMNLKDVPAEMVLRLALRQYGLAFMLENGVVIATTPEEVKQSLEIRVYSVGDLVQPPGQLAAAVFETGPRPYAGPPTYELGARLGASSHVAGLIDLITSTVNPTSWNEAGGAATIRDYRGALVITQTYQGHHKVEKLLEGLRGAIVPKLPAGPVSVGKGGMGMGGMGMGTGRIIGKGGMGMGGMGMGPGRIIGKGGSSKDATSDKK